MSNLENFVPYMPHGEATLASDRWNNRATWPDVQTALVQTRLAL